jgi:hypothetical protein
MERITLKNYAPTYGKTPSDDTLPVLSGFWNRAVAYLTTFMPSAGVLVGNLTGNATTATTAAGVAYATADLATVAPTNAQMTAAFGAPTAGNTGVYYDTDAGNAGAGAVTYFCVANGIGWWYEAMTAGL